MKTWLMRQPARWIPVGCLLLVAVVVAEEPGEPDYTDDLPRIPAVAAEQAAATMELAEGFRLELMAAEPLLASPVAIDWDEDARLFVSEMRGYSEDEADRLGRIRLLHDDDRDGRYDRAEVFAEGFAWPTALCCWGGGVFVGDAPDIVFLKDTDGDGQADLRERVFTGFGTGNVQGLFNSFRVGLDNRVYGSASSTGGSVQRVVDDEPVGEAVNLRGRDFSFDPRRFDLRPETGGAQHGMSFDDAGRRYVCSNSDHAIRCMIDDRYLGRNPDYPAPSGRESIAVEGPQAEVFRVSPVEPWRVLRTRLRASGIVPGIVEGGGRPAGYFTSATGITVVRGSAVGELQGMLVVGDVGSNLVHRKRLLSDGVGVRAERVDQGRELLASHDIWFRPVQFANGPDGGLWIVDMQREVIEHPKSLPPSIKQHLDLTSGRDAGRLWRLTDSGQAVPVMPPPLNDASGEQLVALLCNANAWHRETAQRLLVERGDASVVAELRDLLADDVAEPRGRLHALWTLAGLEQLHADDCLVACAADDASLRAAGVRLSEMFLGTLGQAEAAADAEAIVTELERLASLKSVSLEADGEVRLQLALTAGFVSDDDRRRGLLDRLLARDGSDRWCRVAACSSMQAGDAAAVALRWMADPERLQTSAAVATIPELFAQIGRRGDDQELQAAGAAIARLRAIAGGTDDLQQDDAVLLAARLARELAAAVGTGGRSFDSPQMVSLMRELAVACSKMAMDEDRPVAQRADAAAGITLAGLTPQAAADVAALIDDKQAAVAGAAVDAVSRLSDPAADRLLLASLTSAADTVRPRVVTAAIGNRSRAALVLDAVAAEQLTPSVLGQAAVERLWRYPDAEIRKQAAAVLGPPPPADRQPMVNAYRASLPAGPGNADAGRTVFRKHCVSCHRVEGVGHQLGPSLAAMQARGPEAMLLGILDPNREVLPAFTARTAVSADGRVLTGVLTAEGDASITLQAADGQQQVLARDDLDELIDTGRSLMPEGFERSINPNEMADLLTYLMSAQ
jgi:putative membrane-bound dehydrogenase-like protein